jgi:16S rRNA G966 N2-methylase RsmD
MNVILLEGEALSRCAKSMTAMLDDEARFESIFDNLQQLEEEEQVGRAEQQG